MAKNEETDKKLLAQKSKKGILKTVRYVLKARPARLIDARRAT